MNRHADTSRQYGFTIVELLIVIVVIGILAALVMNTFAGAQKKARDSERITDVKSVQKNLEAYYTEKGHYVNSYRILDPNAPTLLSSYLTSLNPEALRAPGAASGVVSSWGQWQGNVTSGNYQYAYKAYTSDGSNSGNCSSSSISDTLCYRYEIFYRHEEKNTVIVLKSLYGW